MRRRRLLRALVVLPALGAGCLSDLPTSTGPRAGPTPDGTPGERSGATVSDVDVEEADDGRLRVAVTVRNRDPQPADARVFVTVTVDDERTVRETGVSVPGGGTATAAVEFETTFEAFAGNGNVDARVG